MGREGVWILKAKGFHRNIIEDVRKASVFSYIFTLTQCKHFEKVEKMNECEDSLYGGMLSKYITDKNINDIQLTKMEYVTMSIDSKSCAAEFEHFESISNSDDFSAIQDFIDNPDLDKNKQRITKFFAKMNVEINADELANEMPKYKNLLNYYSFLPKDHVKIFNSPFFKIRRIIHPFIKFFLKYFNYIIYRLIDNMLLKTSQSRAPCGIC